MVGIGDRLARQYRCAGRFNNVTQDVRIVRFECGRAPPERAARANIIAEYLNCPIGLPQDFRRGMQIVRPRTTRQMELIGAEGIPLFR